MPLIALYGAFRKFATFKKDLENLGKFHKFGNLENLKLFKKKLENFEKIN